MAVVNLVFNTPEANTRELWKRALAEVGLNLVAGSFTDGGTLANASDVLWDKTNAQCYTWSGAFPKTVPIRSTVAGTGGASWLSVSAKTFRAALGAVDGASLVGSTNYAGIRAYAGTATRIECSGVSNVFDGGAGTFVLDSADTTSADNGGTILVGVGGRRWKRQYAGPVYARWFGVVANGATDDTVAVNKATATLQHVILPAGTIVISAPILFGTQIIEGVGTYPNQSFGTIVQCTGDHAGFEHTPTGYQPGGAIKHVWINYQSTKPTITTGKSRGIDFGTSDTSIDPNVNGAMNFIVENVIVMGAYYGFYDVTSTYLMEYRNCWAWRCFVGFVKDLGTTIKYSSCYALECYGGWRIRFCHCATFENCAYDQTSIMGTIVPFYAGSCPGLTINGMQHESSIINVAGRTDMVIEDCRGFNLNGMSVPSWRSTVAGASDDAILIEVKGRSTGCISALTVSDIAADVNSAGSNVYHILVRDNSKVRVTGCDLPACSGAAATLSLVTSGTGILEYDHTVFKGGSVAGAGALMNGMSQSVQFDVNTTVPGNSLVDAGTQPLPGLTSNDVLEYSSDFVPTGCSIIPMYISPGVCGISIVNHLTGAKALMGHVFVRYSKG